jgi:hypothetical protein
MSSLPKPAPALVCVCVCAFLSAFAGVADAAEDEERVPEVVQELFLGPIVYPQGQLELQAGAGFQWKRGEEGDVFSVPFAIEIGLTDRFQLGVGLAAERSSVEGAAVDISPEVGALYNAHNDPAIGSALSLGCEIGLPVASPGGPRVLAIEPFLVGYKSFAPVHLNLSLSLSMESSPPGESGLEVSFEPAVGALFGDGPVVTSIEIGAELGAETPAVTVAPGLFLHPWDDVEIAIAAPLTFPDKSAGVVLSLVVERELAPNEF